ncbi:MAG: hypothetical protein ACOC1S_00235 [bacterium]
MTQILVLIIFLFILQDNSSLHNKGKPKTKIQKPPTNKRKFTKTSKFEKKFKIKKDTPHKINSGKISATVKPAGDRKQVQLTESNYLFLSILWAHFQAYKQGELKMDAPAPWEKIEPIKRNKSSANKNWGKFLKNIIGNKKDITQWINDVKKLKQKTINSFPPSPEK